MKHLQIFCDGGISNNGHKDSDKETIGSYGSIIVRDNKVIYKFSEWYEDQYDSYSITNNTMELMGFIKAYTEFLKRYKSNDKYTITVISDSQYLIKGINEWLPNWKKRRWKNSSGNTIENLYMWKIIDKLLVYEPKITLKFEWQRGHQGKKTSLEEDPNIYFNEMVDSLASEQIAEGTKEGAEWLIPNEETLRYELDQIAKIINVKE